MTQTDEIGSKLLGQRIVNNRTMKDVMSWHALRTTHSLSDFSLQGETKVGDRYVRVNTRARVFIHNHTVSSYSSHGGDGIRNTR
jgi:hypothetical protein